MTAAPRERPAESPGEQLHVEMVLPSLIAAGMEVMVADLAKGLTGRGHRVGITSLLGRGALDSEMEAAGIRVRHVAPPGRLGNAYPAALARTIAGEAPDVVHIHSGVWLKAARAARIARVPRIVYTAHGLPEPERMLSTLACNLAGRSTDAAVGVSQSVCDFLINRARLPAGKVVLIPNGVDTERYAPSGAGSGLRSEIGAAPGDCIIGIVARLAPIKDHATLLMAFEQLARRTATARLVIVGDGPLRPTLQQMASTLESRDRISFLGTRRDMPAVYRDLDIVTLSSLSEGTSLSLLEAMASGRPCVATAVGGNPEVLAGGTAGVLVPPADPAALARALETLVHDPRRRASIGAAGREWVLKQYSDRAMILGYESLYTKRAAGRQPSMGPR